MTEPTWDYCLIVSDENKERILGIKPDGSIELGHDFQSPDDYKKAWEVFAKFIASKSNPYDQIERLTRELAEKERQLADAEKLIEHLSTGITAGFRK
jgi:ABC-type Fe3+-hydroxamate transport system substrate-binding protein